MKRNLAAILLFTICLSQVAFAQGSREDVIAKIRTEAMDNSQIMKTLHMFTDVYGPRLTGSPKLEMAGKWAMEEMNRWGFDKTYREEWDWGHVGWENDVATGHIISPVKDALVFEVLAWTPSTKGVVEADAVSMTMPNGPQTQSQLDAYFDEWRAKIRGKIVLVGNPRAVPVNFEPPPKRIDDEQLAQRLSRNPNPQGPRRPAINNPEPAPDVLSFREVMTQVEKFIVDSEVLVRIDDAGREHGQIRAFSNRSYDPTTTVPTVVMRNEDFGRIHRILGDGTNVKLQFYIRNSIYPNGKTVYNVLGEITGRDKKDEVIMLGGHLDSWHSATGATDNAIGCAVMMEAARILKAVGVKPRRTIRVALWSGEEQGLLGSQAYVMRHFGTFEDPKPDYKKFGGYFNIDSGTGRARVFSVFGPDAAAPILDSSTASFRDLGFAGVTTTASRGLGGSDHTSFNMAGLPGIGVMQDPIEYFTHTWHTNLDTYERIVESDVKASAAIIAAAVYDLSTRDELLPRYSAEEMPKPR
ncbi:MAG: M20/M25/M40 family metallo-hydrolase [Pyrinomonadaceae bacterium]